MLSDIQNWIMYDFLFFQTILKFINFLILKSYLNELAGKQKGFTLTIEMKH